MLPRPYSFLIFLINSPLTYKLQIFSSYFDNVLPTPPPPHAKASRRWSFLAISTVFHHHHLPRTQKRAGGGFFTFRLHVPNTTSLACKSEPEVVFFSRFNNVSPTPPPSYAKASRRWFSFHVSTTCHQHHLPRMQKRAGGGFIFTFRQRVANTTSIQPSPYPYP